MPDPGELSISSPSSWLPDPIAPFSVRSTRRLTSRRDRLHANQKPDLPLPAPALVWLDRSFCDGLSARRIHAEAGRLLAIVAETYFPSAQLWGISRRALEGSPAPSPSRMFPLSCRDL